MRLDGVPGGQVLPGALQLPVLVGRPQAIPCGPGDADVMPAIVLQAQRQLGHLDIGPATPGQRCPKSQGWTSGVGTRRPVFFPGTEARLDSPLPPSPVSFLSLFPLSPQLNQAASLRSQGTIQNWFSGVSRSLIHPLTGL